MSSKLMRRVERTARALVKGSQVVEFLTSPTVQKRLVAAADRGEPPVSAISSDLLGLLGRRDARLAPMRQLAGLCVRAILEDSGFTAAADRVRLSNDPVFRTGLVYERVTTPPIAGVEGLLKRQLAALSDQEARVALKILRARLRD